MTTDYKHFPRVIRPQITTEHTNKLFVLLVIILILAGMSMSGHEDMTAQVLIDKALLLEHTKKAVAADEQAALYFYQQQAAK